MKLHSQEKLSYSSDLFPILFFTEVNPRIFCEITSILWKYLGEKELDSTQIVSLLYQLHNFLSDTLVEDVIGKEISKNKSFWFYKQKTTIACDISYKRNAHYIDMFRKFELLWKNEENRQKGFTSILMLFLDILTFPNNEPFKNVMLKWLHGAILKGDIERIMQPFLSILLSLETVRVTIADYSKVSEIVKIETHSNLKKNSMVFIYISKYNSGT